MNILLQSRTNLFTRPGGDGGVMAALAKELRLAGHEAHISSSLQEDVRLYDVVHLFNVTRPHETLFQAMWAKRFHKPVVLTPIFQDFALWNRYGRLGGQRAILNLLPASAANRMKNLVRSVWDQHAWKTLPLQLKWDSANQLTRLFEHVDLLLPQSDAEASDLRRRFHLRLPMAIAPFGVDPTLQDISPHPFIEFSRMQNFILCVANFASIKNHLTLLEAVAPLHLPLIFIGNEVPFHRSYVAELKKRAACLPHVKIYEQLDRALVLSAFAAAKVHVIASWFETCELVSLEAGILNCNVVTTNQGYGGETFGDFAWYCDPRDPSSIQATVRQAFAAPVSPDLKQHLIKHFTWKQMTTKVLNAYQSVLVSNSAASRS